jgi:hypothetical protein
MPSSRGTVSMKESEQLHIARQMDVRATSTCAHCGKSWTGWLATVSEAFTAHRKEAHPEVKVTQKRKRHRAFGQLSGGRGLDENIQNARTTGAATWAGPDEPA